MSSNPLFLNIGIFSAIVGVALAAYSQYARDWMEPKHQQWLEYVAAILIFAGFATMTSQCVVSNQEAPALQSVEVSR